MTDLDRFNTIWVLDFEFIAKEGDNHDPVCLVARELRRGTFLRLWRNEFTRQSPLETGSQTLYVAFYASAEWNCYPCPRVAPSDGLYRPLCGIPGIDQ